MRMFLRKKYYSVYIDMIKIWIIIIKYELGIMNCYKLGIVNYELNNNL